MDKTDLLKRVKEDNVKFISYQFTDVTGTVKSLDAPINQLEAAIDRGVWFDGSSVEGFARIQESDMHLYIDPETYAVLPWTPDDMRRARVFCDIYTPDGKPFQGDPRGELKRYLEEVRKTRGFIFNVGAEPEFFLFRRNGIDNIHPVPHDVGSYFDFSPNDEAVRVRTELMSALNTMGMEIEVGHHEVALGQHEIDFRFSNALQAADNVITLKYTVKAIAAQNNLVASFMPKPVFGINGSGMHCHQSLFSIEGENLFYEDNDPFNLSQLGYHYIAGQLTHARSLSAIVSPTINSYKRLVPGYEAPVYIGWAQTNRSALIRLPRYLKGQKNALRAELRCPDPSCNPYLAFKAMLVTALDGVDKQLTCPEPLNNINVYELSKEERRAMGINDLPSSLSRALDELEKNALLKTSLGPVLMEAFMRAKRAECEAYRIQVMDWELNKYLETA